MPAYRFAFTVRVSSQDEFVSIFQGSGNVLHPLAALIGHLPAHFEIIIGLYRPVFRGQIADMTIRGEDFKVAAKILIYGFGFCR